MVTANNYMFRPLTGHHQDVHLMKRAEGCTIYNVTTVWWDLVHRIVYIITRLTFESLAVRLRTTRINIQKFLHGARFALSVLYGSQKRQRPLLYTALTGWFL